MLKQVKKSEVISVETVMINDSPVIMTTSTVDEFVDEETGDEWIWTGREYINCSKEI